MYSVLNVSYRLKILSALDLTLINIVRSIWLAGGFLCVGMDLYIDQDF